MTAQDRFGRALDALAEAEAADPNGYEYEIDSEADALRVRATGDTYSWAEIPEHVRDHWREEASR